MIAVTAATGKTGQAIIQAAAAAGLPVRAVVHSEDGRATAIQDGAAEAVVADLLMPAQVSDALAGTQAVVHIGPAMHPREIAIGETVVDAAAALGIDHFVLMSVTHPQLEPLLNHQSKLAVERRLLLSRLRYTILQPMHYMQDIDVLAAASSGIYQQPYSLERPLSFVDLHDVGEVAARVLADPQHHTAATYELCGADTLTGHQVAEILATVTASDVRAQEVAPSEIVSRLTNAPDYTIDGRLRLFTHYDRYGITGNPNVLSWLLGRAPTSFAEYVKRALGA
ncbi:MAG: NmrA family NAD(P)-binding protein [Trebonia sp.]